MWVLQVILLKELNDIESKWMSISFENCSILVPRAERDLEYKEPEVQENLQ
jgi:hypothetical protein